MKIKIRRGCFESNSSSQHSICITKNDKFLTSEGLDEYPESLYINKQRILNLSYDKENLEFDRHPFKFLCTFREKLMFAIASLCSGYENDNSEKAFNEILEAVRRINPNIKDIKLPTRKVCVWEDEKGELISESIIHYDYETGRHYYVKDGHEWNVHESDYSKEEPYYGYVDHQSMGLLKAFLEKENVNLVDFLGNSKYVVIIDGDEFCDWDLFKYSGLINIANIEKEFGI